MYTPRALFSRLFLKVFFVLPLYIGGRLVTSLVKQVSNLYHYRLRDRGQSMVCVHTYSESDNALLTYGRLKFSKMAAGRHLEFDPTGNGAVGSAVPEKPTLETNSKSIG